MKKEDDITIWRFFKTLFTLACAVITIGLLVIDQESVGSVFADVWWAYAILLVFDVGELIKNALTKQ
jgi:hypothetical protein